MSEPVNRGRLDRERVAPTAPWCGVPAKQAGSFDMRHVSKIMMLFRIFCGGIPVAKMDFLLVSLTPIKTGVHKTFRTSLPEGADKAPLFERG